MGSSLSPPGPNAVHLCVDMQNLFTSRGPWPTPRMEKALPSVARLAAHSPERTVFTRFIPPASASGAGGMWRELQKVGQCHARPAQPGCFGACARASRICAACRCD